MPRMTGGRPMMLMNDLLSGLLRRSSSGGFGLITLFCQRCLDFGMDMDGGILEGDAGLSGTSSTAASFVSSDSSANNESIVSRAFSEPGVAASIVSNGCWLLLVV